MLLALALLGPLAAAPIPDLAATPPSPFDQTVALTIEPRDAADPPIEVGVRHVWTPQHTGRLLLWATGEAGHDLALRVEAQDGTLLDEDDDEGGGGTPFLQVEARAGDALVAWLSAEQVSAPTSVKLHIVAVLENEATAGVPELVRQALQAVGTPTDAESRARARTVIAGRIGELLKLPGAEHSEHVHQGLHELGAAATRRLQDPELALQALRAAYPHFLRTLPAEHPGLQYFRVELAFALKDVGERALALELAEIAHASSVRSLRDDDPRLQSARAVLAMVRKSIGDLAGARELEEAAIRSMSGSPATKATNLQRVLGNLATTLNRSGDLLEARRILEQLVLDRERTLPPDDLELQTSRMNLALTVDSLGDHQRARALLESVCTSLARSVGSHHPMFARAQANLAGILRDVGEPERARELEQAALETLEASLPEDHPDLARARQNLAATLENLGDREGAEALARQVLERHERQLPEDHPELQLARQNLGLLHQSAGRVDAAVELARLVFAHRQRDLPEGHEDLQAARINLLVSLAASAALEQQAAAPQAARIESWRAECVELARGLARGMRVAIREASFSTSIRQAEERCTSTGSALRALVSLADGLGVFGPQSELEPLVFEVSEATRAATLTSAALLRAAGADAGHAALRQRWLLAKEALSAALSGGVDREGYRSALAACERIEAELVELGRARGGLDPAALVLDAPSIQRGLEPGTALVALRGHSSFRIQLGPPDARTGLRPVRTHPVHRIEACVVRPAAPAVATGAVAPAMPLRVDLGEREALERLVEDWRATLGVAADARGVAPGRAPAEPELSRRAGLRLRAALLDPLLPHLQGATRIHYIADDCFHLVPLDALPLESGPGSPAGPEPCVGDRWQIEVHVDASELLRARSHDEGSDELTALGAADFGPSDRPAAAAGADADIRAWNPTFAALPAAEAEVRGIAAQFHATRPGGPAAVLALGGDAQRELLLRRAPETGWLHIATHGWFAPHSVRAWTDDPAQESEAVRGALGGAGARVLGMSPMLLCGIALAGANAAPDATGRVPGLLTAEELAAADLSNCRLAVLSACESGVGPRRAGQGVASLQRALHMAGARNALTSVWKVPDDATRELMLEFYRRIWVLQEPRHQALWEAKRALRSAPGGERRPLRDWAGWVLTGPSEPARAR